MEGQTNRQKTEDCVEQAKSTRKFVTLHVRQEQEISRSIYVISWGCQKGAS